MAIKHIPRPRDPVQLGKLIGDIATGQITDAVDDGKDPAASELGRVGGIKGGRARSDALTSEQRAQIAQKAALARWAKKR